MNQHITRKNCGAGTGPQLKQSWYPWKMNWNVASTEVASHSNERTAAASSARIPGMSSTKRTQCDELSDDHRGEHAAAHSVDGQPGVRSQYRLCEVGRGCSAHITGNAASVSAAVAIARPTKLTGRLCHARAVAEVL